jgi:recombinational DNA repair protein RecT
MRTAAVFVRLKFSAQRRTLQCRLVMHEHHEAWVTAEIIKHRIDFNQSDVVAGAFAVARPISSIARF